MLRVMGCVNCGVKSFPVGAVTVQIRLSKEPDEYNYFFCSPSCMITWMHCRPDKLLKDVARFRAGLQPYAGSEFAGAPDSGVNHPPDPVVCETYKQERGVADELVIAKMGSELKKPEEFFTDPNPSTIIEEVKAALAKEEQNLFPKAKEADKFCASHCCVKHGCKYGFPDCPVVAGKLPSNDCEECGLERERHYDEMEYDDTGKDGIGIG